MNFIRLHTIQTIAAERWAKDSAIILNREEILTMKPRINNIEQVITIIQFKNKEFLCVWETIDEILTSPRIHP